jgi:hypothetical protein
MFCGETKPKRKAIGKDRRRSYSARNSSIEFEAKRPVAMMFSRFGED